MNNPIDSFVIRPFWGYYEMKPCGLFAFNKVWHHNPALDMSKDEQLKQNKANHKDFSEKEHIPPAIKLVSV